MTDISRPLSSQLQNYDAAPPASFAGDPRWVVIPDDRIGAPPIDRRRRRRRRLAGLAVMLALGGWLWSNDHLTWVQPLASDLARHLAEAMPQWPSTDAGKPAETPQLALAPLELIVAREIEAAPLAPDFARPPEADRRDSTPAPASEAAAPDPAVAAGERTAAAAPPAASDPLARQAEAAGLHPGLSRVVLARLSAEDFRNARIAISRAIAETPDEAALEWPRAVSAGLARFRVHFVPGVAERCRRYVVTIAKDGWLTTALPMEACGVVAPVARKQ